VARPIDVLPTDPAEIADQRVRALADPIYPADRPRDGSAAAINLSFHEISDREFVDQRLDERIREIALAERAWARVPLHGRPHVVAHRGHQPRTLAPDPLAVAVAALVVFLTTGSARGAAAAARLPDVGALTFGLPALTGTPVNLLTLVLAPILISLGGLYGVHIVARWEEEREHVDNARDAALATPGTSSARSSGVTTTVGFAALIPAGSRHRGARHVAFRLLDVDPISLAGTRVAARSAPQWTRRPPPQAAFGRRLDDALVRVAGLCASHATPVLGAWALRP
jgi:hypothetical protein